MRVVGARAGAEPWLTSLQQRVLIWAYGAAIETSLIFVLTRAASLVSFLRFRCFVAEDIVSCAAPSQTAAHVRPCTGRRAVGCFGTKTDSARICQILVRIEADQVVILR
jgi:hypothetical protein